MTFIEGLSDLHLGDQKVTWKKLITSFQMVIFWLNPAFCLFWPTWKTFKIPYKSRRRSRWFWRALTDFNLTSCWCMVVGWDKVGNTQVAPENLGEAEVLGPFPNRQQLGVASFATPFWWLVWYMLLVYWSLSLTQTKKKIVPTSIGRLLCSGRYLSLLLFEKDTSKAIEINVTPRKTSMSPKKWLFQ